MSEVRRPVERDADDALCCPRCVALDGYEDAPDLAATLDEYELPTAVLGEPRPARETVPALGWYCDEHDVFLTATYTELAASGELRDDEDWIAVPLHTGTDQPIAVPVRLGEMLGESA